MVSFNAHVRNAVKKQNKKVKRHFSKHHLTTDQRSMRTLILFAAVIGLASVASGCICPLYYDPVCGSNNVTYGNTCQMNCDQGVSVILPIEYELSMH